MRRFLYGVVTSLMFIALLACEQVPNEDKDKDKHYKLADSPLALSDKSKHVLNVVEYAQMKNPHKEIEKDFLFNNTNNQTYRIKRDKFDARGCLSGNTRFASYLIRNDKAVEIVGEETFAPKKDDELRIVLQNNGGCQFLSFSFYVLEAD